jgi:hypothetical protein
MLAAGMGAPLLSDGYRPLVYFHIAQIDQAWSRMVAEMYIIELASFIIRCQFDIVNKTPSKDNDRET